jgi:hypothetical protein
LAISNQKSERAGAAHRGEYGETAGAIEQVSVSNDAKLSKAPSAIIANAAMTADATKPSIRPTYRASDAASCAGK